VAFFPLASPLAALAFLAGALVATFLTAAGFLVAAAAFFSYFFY
jgi:hypothetical protein